MGQILEDLRADFGFTGVLGGEEYENFSEVKKEIVDRLLLQGIAFRIAKANLSTACQKTRVYAKHVSEFALGSRAMVPVWSKPGDVEGLLLTFELLKAEIEHLIVLYDKA